MSANKCPVCDEDVVKGSKDVSEVKEKGILGHIKASKERNDDKYRSFFDSTSLLIHTSCRKNYTRTDTIKKDVRQASSSNEEAGPSQLRSSAPLFDFKNHCFLCTRCLNEDIKKPLNKRRVVHSVETLTVKYRIKEVSSLRNDAWGNEVLGRLSCINDLVAEEAKYHKDCYFSFVKPVSYPKLQKAEIPRDTHVVEAMEEIFAYMEGSPDTQFSQMLSLISAPSRQLRAQLNIIPGAHTTKCSSGSGISCLLKSGDGKI